LNYLSVTEVSDDQKTFSFVYPSGKNVLWKHEYWLQELWKKYFIQNGISPGVNKSDFLFGGYISLGFG